MMLSVHGPMTGAATGAGAAPAVTALLARSVVAPIAIVVTLIFILIPQSSLIAMFAPSKRQRELISNIYKNRRFVTRIRSFRLT